jgi:peroxiredoxin
MPALCLATSAPERELFPKFSFSGIDTATQSTESTAGKVVVLNFWFIACPPCVAEIPSLNAIANDFKGKNVVFIAPTFDSAAMVQKFVKTHPFKYKITTFGSAQPSIYFPEGKMIFPMNVVVDKRGRVTYRSFSEAKPEALKAAIHAALK